MLFQNDGVVDMICTILHFISISYRFQEVVKNAVSFVISDINLIDFLRFLFELLEFSPKYIIDHDDGTRICRLF
jgi:hypothetical protein